MEQERKSSFRIKMSIRLTELCYDNCISIEAILEPIGISIEFVDAAGITIRLSTISPPPPPQTITAANNRKRNRADRERESDWCTLLQILITLNYNPIDSSVYWMRTHNATLLICAPSKFQEFCKNYTQTHRRTYKFTHLCSPLL